MAELEGIDFDQWAVRWWLVITSCVVLLGGFFATGALWGRIVSDLGGPRLPTEESIRLFMVANLGRYVPGKVWQITGLVVLARSRGVPGPTAAAAAVLGQGTGLAAATLIGLGAVWTLADGAAWRWAVPIGVIGGIVLGLTPVVFHALARFWFRLAKTEQPEGLSPVDGMRWFVIALATWCLYAGAFWMLVEGLGFHTPFLSTASAFAAAYVLGYVVVFAPAGIGVREGALLALLAPGLGAGAAGAVAAIARLWTTIIEVIPAAAFWTRHLATADGAPKSGE